MSNPKSQKPKRLKTPSHDGYYPDPLSLSDKSPGWLNILYRNPTPFNYARFPSMYSKKKIE